MKTSELTGAALDWAVAKCEKPEWLGNQAEIYVIKAGFSPSTQWSQGGPIIERERINMDSKVGWAPGADNFGLYFRAWQGTHYDDPDGSAYGPTPLIAAMRCYVASKLSDDVEIPGELAVQL